MRSLAFGHEMCFCANWIFDEASCGFQLALIKNFRKSDDGMKRLVEQRKRFPRKTQWFIANKAEQQQHQQPSSKCAQNSRNYKKLVNIFSAEFCHLVECGTNVAETLQPLTEQSVIYCPVFPSDILNKSHADISLALLTISQIVLNYQQHSLHAVVTAINIKFTGKKFKVFNTKAK